MTPFREVDGALFFTESGCVMLFASSGIRFAAEAICNPRVATHDGREEMYNEPVAIGHAPEAMHD